jgi:hypothetical protein
LEPLTIEDIAVPFSNVFPVKLHLGTLSGKRTNIYDYLASAQHTKYAVVPIHTSGEVALFENSVKLGGKWFVSVGQPSFENMAAWWSTESNGKTIFYKLPEHLISQYKTWNTRQLQRQTMVATRPQRRPNELRIRATTHAAQLLPAMTVFDTTGRAWATQKHSATRSDIPVSLFTINLSCC